jgi:hypothetical protein
MMNPVVEALSLLTPFDIDKFKVRIGPPSDGGYVFVDDISPDQAIISYGISTEYRFDAEMAERGHDVWMFDHTIEGVNVTNPRMHFYKEGVAGVSRPDDRLYSIEDHLNKYGVQGDRMILKMDVEGAEWDAILATSDSVLARFEQIVIEIHGLALLDDEVFRSKFVKTLRRINRLFTLHHVHGNNCDGIRFAGGFPVSNLLELSYVKTMSVVRRPSRTLYPTAYDHPNVGHLRDKLLWFFPFLPTSATTAEFLLCADRAESWERPLA